MTLPRCCRRPYAAGDEHGQRAHVAPHTHPAVNGIWPRRDRDREAENERQPEIRAEGRSARLLLFTFSTLGIPAMTQLVLRWLGGKTVVLAFDLTQLDCPVDLAQRSLLPSAMASSLRTTGAGGAWQRAMPRGPSSWPEGKCMPRAGRITAPCFLFQRTTGDGQRAVSGVTLSSDTDDVEGALTDRRIAPSQG